MVAMDRGKTPNPVKLITAILSPKVDTLESFNSSALDNDNSMAKMIVMSFSETKRHLHIILMLEPCYGASSLFELAFECYGPPP